LWDRERRTLTLARDRMGEKPLYYGYTGASLVFASELKGLMPIPGFGRELNRAAIASLMRHNYVPSPQSIYEGIYKLPAGTWLEIAEPDMRARRVPTHHAYWSALQIADQGLQTRSSFASDTQATDELEAVLSK